MSTGPFSRRIARSCAGSRRSTSMSRRFRMRSRSSRASVRLRGGAPQAQVRHGGGHQGGRGTVVPLSINDRKLPDKAIDVIDEVRCEYRCCCWSSMPPQDDRRAGGRGHDRDDGAHSAEGRLEGRRRGVAASRVQPEARCLRPGRGDHGAVCIDQPCWRGLLQEPEKLIGSYLFAGPTGVGARKTGSRRSQAVGEASGCSSASTYMSEIRERHTVSAV